MSTLLKLVGYEGDPSRHLQLDGVDQSEALLTGQSMVYNLISDPLSGAYRKGPFKIIFGVKFSRQGWYDTDHTALQCSRIRDKESRIKKRKQESSQSRPSRNKNRIKKKVAGYNNAGGARPVSASLLS